jgi:predicted LPLAT superfamily acyltransferase
MRNPGPSWGFAFLQRTDRLLPWPAYRVLLGIGAAVAAACMPAQRRHSRDFLGVALGRRPGAADVWRHFYTYAVFLTIKLRVARGLSHRGGFEPGHEGDFEALVGTGKPAFFGTFHFGHSDLIGYLLGHHFRRRVFMVRLQMGNAAETAQLERLFGEWIKVLWVSKPENMLFALKEAVASGGSLAMQCDRTEFTSKTGYFDFLGARRQFPVTIYHLALVFDRPVIFCVGMPGKSMDETVLHSSPAFVPDPAVGRAANLRRAHEHFQAVIAHLESLVRQHPYLWLNFLALNPAAPPGDEGAP